MKPYTLFCLTTLALTIPAAQAATLYSQTFTPGAGTAVLNGTSPTAGTGSGNWEASTDRFQADGDFIAGQGSATLAFTPVNGLVYTLDASIRNLTATADVGSPEQDWIALGFAKGQSSLSGNNDRFINNNVIGKAWMLYRGVDTVGTVDNATQLGTATSGNNAGASPSTTASWSSLASTFGGGIDMRVELDTTAGAGNWTATWFAKLPASGSFTEVRGATTLLNEDIDSVGVALSGPGFEGDLTSFSLTSVPEPSSTALLGLASIALLIRRRR